MNKGMPIIRKYEGLRLRAYICPSGLPTIGYGATFYENGSRVQMGDVITIDRADKLLHLQVKLFADEVKSTGGTYILLL
jgi:lysozyme